MKRIVTDHIIVHCAATKPSQDIGAADIERWHKQRGFARIGYHFVIRRDGTVERGRQMHEVGAHVMGFNSRSVGICLVGGLSDNGDPEDNYTTEQMEMLRLIIDGVRANFPLAVVVGHRDIPGAGKACPCFDVATWYKTGARHPDPETQT